MKTLRRQAAQLIGIVKGVKQYVSDAIQFDFEQAGGEGLILDMDQGALTACEGYCLSLSRIVAAALEGGDAANFEQLAENVRLASRGHLGSAAFLQSLNLVSKQPRSRIGGDGG